LHVVNGKYIQMFGSQPALEMKLVQGRSLAAHAVIKYTYINLYIYG